MSSIVAPVCRARWAPSACLRTSVSCAMQPCMRRQFTFSLPRRRSEEEGKKSDPRTDELGRVITDEFASIRTEKYATPKNPIILAHGLLGFDELKLAGDFLPGVQYWRGIIEALRTNDIEVITASVPASGSIEERAAKLGRDIAQKAEGKSVNIVAHSMGGLDARYMISQLQPDDVEVLSLTTIATPHRGSSFADWCFDSIPPNNIGHLYSLFESVGMETGAFSQLTTRYMREEFNPRTPDDETVRYFSYGAMTTPSIWSMFRQPHRIIEQFEGPNDGLVSVSSSKWGVYKGTLQNVNHLDLINWTNRLKWMMGSIMGTKRQFNAIAFYLDIADMLAKEGL